MNEARRRILIVDDDTAVAAVTADMVRSFGHLAVVAWDKQSALAFWKETERAFDLVIIDYFLGSESGLALAASLAADNPAVPFILMSGMIEQNLDLPSERVTFLEKPFTVGELKKKIERSLGTDQPKRKPKSS